MLVVYLRGPLVYVTQCLGLFLVHIPRVWSVPAGAIVGISCAILFLLFVFQRVGTSKVGFTFAPIVLVWFAANVMINLYNIIIYYPGDDLI